MADRMFPTAKKKLMDADIDLLIHDIKVAMMLSTYTYDSADEFVSDLSASIATSGRSAAMTGKSTTAGVFDAADVSITPATSQTVGSLVIYRDDGVGDSSSPVIAFLDSFSGLPLTTNGSSIDIVWDNGANKIFAFTDV